MDVGNILKVRISYIETRAFLRKVYSILSLQVLLTTVTSMLFLYFDSIRTFVHESPALILVCALGSLGLILALTLNRHKHPLNLYLLFGFTLLEALTVAFVVTFYDVYIVLQAFILTTAVFLGLTVCTLQSKRDFSKFGAGLFATLWILCLSGILKAPDVQAQRPRPTDPAAPRHAGSPQTGARTSVPCIGRRTPNHCATREAPTSIFYRK
ncbi:protein lifeguard 4 isoform X2 [Pontoporia blainvillei]|uniref:Protein lifeguard 4 isoform X2 n=1 Tax=Pontoporia blainvillei TaxID=48723 RepID=A0ABX0S3Q0_PONBL|nr:protein lifeguard 4 isoform X2 [Pontoporia blainvillei]